ncbi:hypothetical protein CIRG_09485 [Coccidioides immitis RMSCC 2394]|uniref:Uncharacterized protein n=1 Tax=Coccidioides immitis RMSCC 2394 TaxID=404692 RepID=A0A0J6YNM6_COCIT|nr:hypothetical protein CIRG_09485 [Coccidioides immitis RMSCC 2394]
MTGGEIRQITRDAAPFQSLLIAPVNTKSESQEIALANRTPHHAAGLCVELTRIFLPSNQGPEQNALLLLPDSEQHPCTALAIPLTVALETPTSGPDPKVLKMVRWSCILSPPSRVEEVKTQMNSLTHSSLKGDRSLIFANAPGHGDDLLTRTPG